MTTPESTRPPLPPLAELKVGRPRSDELPWPLLLDADPDRERVARYAVPEWTRVMWHEGVALGVYALARHDATRFELMNIAVDPRHRRFGIGRWLLGHAIGLAESKGGRTIDVGTGNSSFAALAFYQRAGFRIVGVVPNYFTDNYREPIVENGIACRDRIELRLSLEPE